MSRDLLASRPPFPLPWNHPLMVGVLCVGFAALDHVFGLSTMPQRAEKHRAQRFAAVGGGNAANAAVAIARLGGHAMLATRIGDDDIGTSILSGLQRDGVDVSHARRLAGHRSAISAILVDEAGERMVINYADDTMPDDAGDIAAMIGPDTRAVMADTRWEPAAMAAFQTIIGKGGAGVVDIDRPPNNPAILQAASHIVASAQALRLMTGHDDLPSALQTLRKSVPGWIAVTDSERGTFYWEGDSVRHCPAFPVTAVDTLGAGDVFHGAFALALAEGMDERTALRFASAAAAIKCTRFGGRDGAPTRSELDEFLTSAS